jgi:hypothetical protein
MPCELAAVPGVTHRAVDRAAIAGIGQSAPGRRAQVTYSAPALRLRCLAPERLACQRLGLAVFTWPAENANPARDPFGDDVGFGR